GDADRAGQGGAGQPRPDDAAGALARDRAAGAAHPRRGQALRGAHLQPGARRHARDRSRRPHPRHGTRPRAGLSLRGEMTAARVLVIGGGVAGLAAAISLRGKADVTLREATEQVGGKLRKGPFGVEEGAEAFLCRLPEGIAAAEEAGLELTHPNAVPARLWLNGKLQKLPSGTLLGVPGDLRAAAPTLGVRGTARALLD